MRYFLIEKFDWILTRKDDKVPLNLEEIKELTKEQYDEWLILHEI